MRLLVYFLMNVLIGLLFVGTFAYSSECQNAHLNQPQNMSMPEESTMRRVHGLWLGRNLASLSKVEFVEYVLTEELVDFSDAHMQILVAHHQLSISKLEKLANLTQTRFVDGDDIEFLRKLSQGLGELLDMSFVDVNLLSIFPAGLFAWIHRSRVHPDNITTDFLVDAYDHHIHSFLLAEQPLPIMLAKEGEDFYSPEFLISMLKKYSYPGDHEEPASDVLKVKRQKRNLFKAYLASIARRPINNSNLSYLETVFSLLEAKNFENKLSQTDLRILSNGFDVGLKQSQSFNRVRSWIIEQFRTENQMVKAVLYPLRAEIFKKDYLDLSSQERTSEGVETQDNENSGQSDQFDKMASYSEFMEILFKDMENAGSQALVMASVDQYFIVKQYLTEDVSSAILLDVVIRYLSFESQDSRFPSHIPALRTIKAPPLDTTLAFRSLLSSSSKVAQIFVLVTWPLENFPNYITNRVFTILDSLFLENSQKPGSRNSVIELMLSNYLLSLGEGRGINIQLVSRFFDKIGVFVGSQEYNMLGTIQKNRMISKISEICRYFIHQEVDNAASEKAALLLKKLPNI